VSGTPHAWRVLEGEGLPGGTSGNAESGGSMPLQALWANLKQLVCATGHDIIPKRGRKEHK